MRAMILYEHCSPHQVTAVETARRYFSEHGHLLVPVEFYFGSLEYGWTLKDKKRSEEWVCLFPDKKQVSNYSLFRELIKEVKKHKIEVLFINGWYGRYAWWLGMFRPFLPCRLVMVSDSVYWDYPRTRLKEFPKKLLMRCMDAGFVAGQPQADYLRSLGMKSEKLTHGNDVVDNSMYTGIPIRTAPVGRTIIIGSAARFIEVKNLPAAMRALARVLKQHPEWKCEWRLAGRGPEEEQLRQLAAELQAPVVFPGFVGYDEMPGFYASLDLYWQPSKKDSWGLVVNEAMASGLPVLVSERCGCAIDLVTSEVGWTHGITEPEMEVALSIALEQSALWPARGEAARCHIEKWGCPRFAASLLESCHKAMATRISALG